MQGNPKIARVASLAVVLAAAAALSACDVVVTSLDAKGKAADQWTRTYPMAAGEVQIVNANGSIDVVGGDGNQVEVVAERTAHATTDEDAKKVLAQVTVSEDVSSGRLRLETKAPTGRRLDVKYHLKVPASVNVTLETQNGGIEVTALKGSVKAEVGNGSVKGIDLAGSVDARSTNGAVKLDLLGVGKEGVRAVTVNGSVQLSVPSSAKADVEASCVNGGISVDGLTLDGPERTRRRVEGRLNGGGPKVVAETTNGGVKIIGK